MNSHNLQHSFTSYKPSLFLTLAFGVSSTRRVSNGRFSGNMKYRILFPLKLNESNVMESLPLIVIFTDFK